MSRAIRFRQDLNDLLDDFMNEPWFASGLTGFGQPLSGQKRLTTGDESRTGALAPVSTTPLDVGLLSSSVANTRWPIINVVEKKDAFEVLAEVPGMRKEDLHVNVEGGFLNLSGERQQEQRQDTDTVHRYESYHGKFQRRFRLPENANIDQVAANCEHGILKIHIPKMQEQTTQRKRIDIM